MPEKLTASFVSLLISVTGCKLPKTREHQLTDVVSSRYWTHYGVSDFLVHKYWTERDRVYVLDCPDTVSSGEKTSIEDKQTNGTLVVNVGKTEESCVNNKRHMPLKEWRSRSKAYLNDFIGDATGLNRDAWLKEERARLTEELEKTRSNLRAAEDETLITSEALSELAEEAEKSRTIIKEKLQRAMQLKTALEKKAVNLTSIIETAPTTYDFQILERAYTIISEHLSKSDASIKLDPDADIAWIDPSIKNDDGAIRGQGFQWRSSIIPEVISKPFEDYYRDLAQKQRYSELVENIDWLKAARARSIDSLTDEDTGISWAALTVPTGDMKTSEVNLRTGFANQAALSLRNENDIFKMEAFLQFPIPETMGCLLLGPGWRSPTLSEVREAAGKLGKEFGKEVDFIVRSDDRPAGINIRFVPGFFYGYSVEVYYRYSTQALCRFHESER